MAVHCSSNVILLAIEYFIDSKGERQNIKLLSTQNNYSPSFGLKKLVIFFISSDKTDKKKTLPELEVQNTLPNEANGWPKGMAFDQGASRPHRKKHRSPTKCLAFEIKANTENIAEYRRKKTCFKSLFYFNYFSF